MTPGPLMLIALIGAHFYFDYAGQGDFMAKAKNPTASIPGVPWRWVMDSHAAIHGAAVALITGFWPLGLAEFSIHSVVDTMKCCGMIGYRTDQVIHLVCKVVWFAIAYAVVMP